MGLIYEQLTYQVRGCIYEVHTALGTGYDEESYQLALEYQLEKSKIPFQSQVFKYVEDRGERIHKFVADIIVEDKLILELKVIQGEFASAHLFQILNYLKCWDKKLGLLVNFGLPRAAIKRLPYTSKEPELFEDYSDIQDLICLSNQSSFYHLRDALLSILETHGIGYGETIYRALLVHELSIQGTSFIAQPTIPVIFDGKLIKRLEIQWPIINNQLLCGIVAMKEDMKVPILQMKNYLKALKLPMGVLANFGKNELEIYGISP